MKPGDFRRLALSCEGAVEGAHMGNADFRVGGRIFATLAAEKQGYGNLLLSPERQAEFVAERPDVFLPVPGGWGRSGATHVRLAVVEEDLLAGALGVAWKLRIEKNQKAARPVSQALAGKKTGARKPPKK
jgi:YjbR